MWNISMAIFQLINYSDQILGSSASLAVIVWPPPNVLEVESSILSWEQMDTFGLSVRGSLL